MHGVAAAAAVTATPTEISPAEYKAGVDPLNKEFADITSKISMYSSSEVLSGTILRPSEKNDLGDLYNRELDVAKRVAELKAPEPCASVQESFRLMYTEMIPYVDNGRANLIMKDVNALEQQSQHLASATHYYVAAQAELKACQ